MNKIFVLCVMVFSLPAHSNTTTEIEVNNTSIVSVQLEVKCDFNNETKRYGFHDWITIRRYSKKSVMVPTGMRKCAFYPHTIW